ncbi:MAG: hypothetical protein ACTHJS_07125 [Xanthobacteraceae bacterium]
MQAVIKPVVRNSGPKAIGYSLIGGALMLIGAGVWVIASSPRVAASTQIEVNPLQMMADAKDLPTSHYNFRDFALAGQEAE